MNFNYLRQIAQAADQLGYYGVLLPTGRSCEDSWVVASAVAPWTERLRYLVAVRPGLQSPSVAARMTATLDRLSNGRLLVNVVTGGDPVENKGDGIFLDHDARYAVTREFLNVYSDLLAGKTVNVEGKHIRIEDGRLLFPAGSVAAAAALFRRLVGCRHRCCRRYRRQIPDLGRAAGAGGREDQPGESRRRRAWAKTLVRHPPARDRSRDQCGSLEGGGRVDPARHRRDGGVGAEDLLAHGLRSASSAWRSCTAAAATSSRSARTSGPALGWCVAAQGTALVGDPQTVAARIREYQDVGIDTFIMSGYPHLEEAYRFAELVFPLLSLKQSNNVTPIRVNTGPFGETIANEHRPLVKASQS